MPQASLEAITIGDVLLRLDAEIERAVRNRSRMAYFACLYRAVTRKVQEGIVNGRFEDGRRMERLDVIFANRYLAALVAHRNGRRATRSWTIAFDAAGAGNLIILQHLLLGMNAHINLDLGVAAAAVAPGSELPHLRKDFNEISRLLGEMLDDVQRRLASVSPWMGLLDRVGNRHDEEIGAFCLSNSRDLAWKAAERFSTLTPRALVHEMDLVDRNVALLAHPIKRPTPALRSALALVRARETSDVERVVRALA